MEGKRQSFGPSRKLADVEFRRLVVTLGPSEKEAQRFFFPSALPQPTFTRLTFLLEMILSSLQPPTTTNQAFYSILQIWIVPRQSTFSHTSEVWLKLLMMSLAALAGEVYGDGARFCWWPYSMATSDASQASFWHVLC